MKNNLTLTWGKAKKHGKTDHNFENPIDLINHDTIAVRAAPTVPIAQKLVSSE